MIRMWFVPGPLSYRRYYRELRRSANRKSTYACERQDHGVVTGQFFTVDPVDPLGATYIAEPYTNREDLIDRWTTLGNSDSMGTSE